MQAEIQTLRKVLHAKSTQYEQKHGKKITAPSVAQMLGNTLYYKRFFPYYTFNVVGSRQCNHSPFDNWCTRIPMSKLHWMM
jgi:20S proteasome alpha/beta subunit